MNSINATSSTSGWINQRQAYEQSAAPALPQTVAVRVKTSPPVVKPQPAAESDQRVSASDPKKTQQPEAKSAASDKKTNSRSTDVRFRVEEDSNDVTILLVDRLSNKVVRTIPPEAIKKLPPGELFQYSA